MSGTHTQSVFDTPPDDAQEGRLDDQAEAEIEAGQGVPHEQVREWLLKLAEGEVIPPPAV